MWLLGRAGSRPLGAADGDLNPIAPDAAPKAPTSRRTAATPILPWAPIGSTRTSARSVGRGRPMTRSRSSWRTRPGRCRACRPRSELLGVLEFAGSRGAASRSARRGRRRAPVSVPRPGPERAARGTARRRRVGRASPGIRQRTSPAEQAGVAQLDARGPLRHNRSGEALVSRRWATRIAGLASQRSRSGVDAGWRSRVRHVRVKTPLPEPALPVPRHHPWRGPPPARPPRPPAPRRRSRIARTLPGAAGVALTFDDGPHPEGTPAVLEILAARAASRRRSSWSASRWSAARRWRPRSPAGATRSRCTATATAPSRALTRPSGANRPGPGHERDRRRPRPDAPPWHRPPYGLYSPAGLSAARAARPRAAAVVALGQGLAPPDDARADRRVGRTRELAPAT